ncbi:MAG TPA: alkaline phosphatase family protein, partial [Actinomycetota bacterium]|nr:alkaline phosphatase family protein [Actinomycetota bacterium]
MSYSPGPGSRVPVPRSRLRSDRRRAARRRGFVAFLAVVLLVIGWQAWGALDGDGERVGVSPPAPTGGDGGAAGDGGKGNSEGEPSPQIVPGETPIEHVVFIVKENRTFNNYFATYPGAEGATEGGTIVCTEDGCRDGPLVQLEEATDIQPHDLTHCFRCGLNAING